MWFKLNFESMRIIFVCKENKNNDFIQQYLLFPVSLDAYLRQYHKWVAAESVLLCFLCTQKVFIKLRLNHWAHMEYFNNILTTFLGLERVSCVAVNAGSESLICVPKMNEGLACLEWNEGE